jgi:hypothetical protein
LHYNQPSRPIDLASVLPVSSGYSRWVFDVPELPNMLLKVNKTVNSTTQSSPLKKFLRALFPASKNRGYTIEIQAYLNVAIKSPEASDMLFPRFFGFVNTNIGIALIYEKMCDPEGRVAPTFFQLIQEGRFVENHRMALNLFFEQLRCEHIVVNDLHERNIVYSNDRFYLVDGLGDKNLIKIRSAFRYFNNRSQMRKCARMVQASDDLKWDGDTRQYVWTH